MHLLHFCAAPSARLGHLTFEGDRVILPKTKGMREPDFLGKNA